MVRAHQGFLFPDAAWSRKGLAVTKIKDNPFDQVARGLRQLLDDLERALNPRQPKRAPVPVPVRVPVRPERRTPR
jgi:hypothetical protein